MADPIIPIVRSQYAAKTEAPKTSQPTITVELPSKGYFYPENHPLASGKIEIYQVTARHEDILSNTNLLKKGTVLDEFLKALIATPNVTTNDLLVGDQNALFVAARKSAYGEMYSVKIKCPDCEVTSNIEIDLSKLLPKTIDFSLAKKGENRMSFALPNSEKVVVFSLLTHKDDVDIDQEIKALAQYGKGATSPEITTRLKYTIQSIDGETNRLKIKQFVDETLTAKDSLALRKFVREHTPDMDMNFQFVCPSCGYQVKMIVPLGANFFWPNVTDTQ
jgi:hypothetical protein